jgi:hypothetical protein
MPTRKQRRRRQKDRRHEWEYVYVDDEGHEVEVEEDATAPAKPARPAVKTAAKLGAKSGRSARAGRKVDPPSWRRVYRRAAIFGPVMVVVVYLLKPKGASPASVAVQVIVLLVFFLPFSYMMDSLMYRAYRKRIGDPIPPRARNSSKS